jgi:hypothetical protein
LLKLGTMLSDSDIERIAQDKEVVEKLEAVKGFKISWSDERPWTNLGEVLSLLKPEK